MLGEIPKVVVPVNTCTNNVRLPWLFLILDITIYGFGTSLAVQGDSNGTPLQYFCLENPMDRGAWWAAVHGVTRVGHDWATSLSLFTYMHCRRKWQPTPVFLPGESQGRAGLVGCRLWGCTESDTTKAMQQQLAVQWLRICIPNAGGMEFNPWLGNENPECYRAKKSLAESIKVKIFIKIYMILKRLKNKFIIFKFEGYMCIESKRYLIACIFDLLKNLLENSWFTILY